MHAGVVVVLVLVKKGGRRLCGWLGDSAIRVGCALIYTRADYAFTASTLSNRV